MVAPAAAVDLAGKPRRYLSDTVDMGAYEYQGKKGAPVAAYTSIVNQATKVVAFTYTGTLPADSVRWIFGDGSTSSQLNPTHTYAARTNFNVCVTTYMSCGSNQKCQQVALAVGNSPALAHVSVYPNPANDFIIIDGMTAGSNVAVLSMVGQQLISNIIVSDRQSISFAALPSGMYLLRLVGDQNEERIIRIVKL
jgi:PKD repeat protein